MASPVINAALETFRGQKRLAERAIEQVTDAQLHESLGKDTNPIAVIVKHMAGNMRSRWTDFLTSDGEKSWRDRDGEFVDTLATRKEVLAAWEEGWRCVFQALEPLSDADLERQILIRGDAQTVVRAILRQIDHYGYHVGQIVLVARLLAGERWQTLSIPRGGSAAYNEREWGRQGR
jgi:hypothetical protein